MKKKPYAIKIGNRLRTQRLKLGYMIKEMSEKTGIPQNTITSIELGYNDCGICYLYELCKAYEIKLEEVL